MKYVTLTNVLLGLSLVLFVLNLLTGNLLAAMAMAISAGSVTYAKVQGAKAAKLQAKYNREIL